MAKVVIIEDCRTCGHARQIGRGGSCIHPEVGSRALQAGMDQSRWEWTIPDWCPLDDAVGRIIDWGK